MPIDQKIYGLKIEEFVNKIPLSEQTISRRVADLSHNIEKHVLEEVQKSPTGFSIQLDESLDIDNEAQLAIFVT